MKTKVKSPASRKYRLLPDEPYEMTYWKEKLRSPLHRFKEALKHLFLGKSHHTA